MLREFSDFMFVKLLEGCLASIMFVFGKYTKGIDFLNDMLKVQGEENLERTDELS